MATDAQYLIDKLGLLPHPEGGFYRETQRSEHSTTIYFLLLPGQPSHFHRVDGAEEVWHHYEGDPLALHTLDASGHQRRVLGVGAAWHAVVAEGVWQAAECLGDRYCLVGCTVAPPFAFDRFSLAEREPLTLAFPDNAGIVRRFTRA